VEHPARSSLRSDELVEQGDGLATRDGDVVSAPRAPVDADEVTRVRKELPYVGRPIRELVARILVVTPLHVDPVQSAPAVGVDEPAQERSRVGVDDRVLSGDQLDPAGVLAARAVLRKQTRPRRPR
jgi:hypothetical protein